MKESHKLRLAFYELEKNYRPFLDLAVEMQEKYPCFKGAVTLDGYLNYQPDILLLAYNPTNAKYRERSYTGAHLVNQGERPFGFFEYGNARKNAEWWKTSAPRGNSFPANIIEFLYSYAEARGQNPEYGTDRKPKWFSKLQIEKSIMTLNLYPIGTKDGELMKWLITQLLKEPDFPMKEKFKNEWDVRLYFLRMLHTFIKEYVQPKCIVCLGTNTMSDYCYGQYRRTASGLYVAKNADNTIGLSRSGNWSNRIKEAGKEAARIVIGR